MNTGKIPLHPVTAAINVAVIKPYREARWSHFWYPVSGSSGPGSSPG